jgi:hypothetical protein
MVRLPSSRGWHGYRSCRNPGPGLALWCGLYRHKSHRASSSPLRRSPRCARQRRSFHPSRTAGAVPQNSHSRSRSPPFVASDGYTLSAEAGPCLAAARQLAIVPAGTQGRSRRHRRRQSRGSVWRDKDRVGDYVGFGTHQASTCENGRNRPAGRSSPLAAIQKGFDRSSPRAHRPRAKRSGKRADGRPEG